MASENTLVSKEVHLLQAGLTNLPSKWTVVEIGELLSPDRGISVGVMYPGKHDSFGIPLLKVGDLRGSVINPNPDFRITPEKHHEYRRTAFEGGELLLTLVGGLGQCAIVPPEMAGWNAARAIAVIRLKEPKDAKFVRVCLLSSPLQHLMQVWANTTVQATLNLKEIKQLPLPWPPAAEREAIAHILGTLDNKIELNQQMNRNLEAIAQAIFKSWFVDFDPVRAKMEGRQPVGMDAATAALFPDSLEDSQLGAIPKGWRVVRLADICSTQYGYTASAKNEKVGSHLLRVMDINKQNWIEWADVPYCEISKADLAKYSLKVGDIVVARMADTGKSAIVEQEVDAVFASYLVRLKTESLSLAYYVYHFLKSPIYKDYTAGAQSGSVQANMNAKVITAVDLVLPPNNLLYAFLDQILPIRKKIVINVEQSGSFVAIRDTLLPKLI